MTCLITLPQVQRGWGPGRGQSHFSSLRLSFIIHKMPTVVAAAPEEAVRTGCVPVCSEQCRVPSAECTITNCVHFEANAVIIMCIKRADLAFLFICPSLIYLLLNKTFCVLGTLLPSCTTSLCLPQSGQLGWQRQVAVVVSVHFCPRS